jgi:guanylate kinase
MNQESTDSVKVNKKGKIIVFSAPSGAGKTTLLNYLRTSIPDLVYSISATTRSPRKGEEHSVHYFFLTESEFREKIENGEFAEWRMVHGNYYGTPRDFIDSTIAAGKNVIMDIDVFGKTKFDAVYQDAEGILILTPGLAELEKRLRSRNSDSEEAIERRMVNASVEMNYALCEGKYKYRIINDNLEKAQAETLTVVRKIIEMP